MNCYVYVLGSEGRRKVIVTLTGLVFEDDPAVASLDAQLILQAPPLPA